MLEEIERTDLDFKEKMLNQNASLQVKGLYSSYAAKLDDDKYNDKTKKKAKQQISKANGKDNPSFILAENLFDKNVQTEPNIIKDINFDCKPKEILVIVGEVGSGKSSILLSILGELFIKHGSISVKGRYSYSSQEAWTFAGTVKENILFNCSFDEKKYKEVIRVCALERDLTLFPLGDQTIVGERGVALSGGQRARINLARALYYDADIYLLDDPLSAVDPHVAKHIFKEAIQGYLNDKIVILVTHQLQFVQNSSKVLLIKEGEQVFYGHYNDLMDEFSSFIGLIDLNEQKERTRRDSTKFGSTISLQTVSKSTPKIFSRQDSTDSIQQNNLFEEQLLTGNEEGECRIRENNVVNFNTTNGRGSSTYIKAGMSRFVGPLG